MNPFHSSNHLIVLVGPTAVGKTSVAIVLAKHFNTEIISADSRQFYMEMCIGTAAPTAEELSEVPQHFIRELSIHDYYNVSRFEQNALTLLEKLFRKHSYVIVAGGSGMYINTLCHGIDKLPDPDAKLRRNIKNAYHQYGIEYLRKNLKELDPDYYQIADLSNPNRMIRAIEICIQTGNTYTSLRKNQVRQRDFNIIKIGLNMPRNELFRRINNRVDDMMGKGLLEEARKLYSFKDFNALQTVGYKELFDFINGKISLELAVEKIKTNTRRYAKRQLTWFKKDPQICWFHPDEVQQIIEYVNVSAGKNKE